MDSIERFPVKGLELWPRGSLGLLRTSHAIRVEGLPASTLYLDSSSSKTL